MIATKYVLVTSYMPDDLAAKIEFNLSQGWQLLGGPLSRTDGLYVQAMVWV